MSGNEQQQQQGSDDDAAPSTHSYYRTHSRINNGGVRRDVLGGAGNSGAGSPYQGEYPSQLEERGGAEPDGGWVDGDGWRMKAPTQKKRQQVRAHTGMFLAHAASGVLRACLAFR